MMKKSIFILLIALILGALSARAATKYEINVAGVEVTSDNKGGVTGGDIKSGTVTYDPSGNVLTLTNVTISRTGGSNYGVHNRKCDNLTIKFVGTCKIESNEANAIHLDRASTVMVTSGSTLTASMTACNNSLRGVVYVNGVTANFNGPGTLNIGGAAKSGTSNRPAGFEGTGKSSNSKINVSYITLNITTPGESFYKFGTVALSSGVDVKCSTSYGSRAVHTTGNLYFNNGVACVTPADAVFSDGMYTQNDGYWHFTDNYGVIVSTANFPDANFRTYLRSLCSSGEQYLTKAQLQNLTSLDVSNKSISDLTGVSRLTYLKTLICSHNQLKALPSLPSTLTYLDCVDNQLTSLPTLPASLITLSCSSNQLSALPTLPASLTYLECNSNQLKALPTLPSALTTLKCGSNRLTDLPTLPDGIQRVYASDNKFTSLYIDRNSSLNTLDVSNNTALTVLHCYKNALTSLTYSGCPLRTLDCSYNQLTSLPTLPATLTTLNCFDNKLTSLPTLPVYLTKLECGYNQLTALPTLPDSIRTVYAVGNKFKSLSITGKSSLVSLDVSRSTTLTKLECQNNGLTALDFSNCANLSTVNCSSNQLTSLCTLPSSLTILNCSGNKFTSLPILPSSLTILNCSGNALIWSPTLPDGIEVIYAIGNKFTSLSITGKSSLKTLDVSNNTALKSLDCSGNGLTDLKYSGCTSLETLNCSSNQLTDLPTLPSTIETVDANNNNLSTLTITGKKSLKTLNVAGNTSLAYLECRLSALTTLNCSGCTALQTIYADNNKFSTLTITGMSKLETLDVSSNKLNNLSVEGCKNLIELQIQNNQIKGSAMTELINSMPTLPDGTGSWFYVLDPRKDEGNEITDAQVKAANAKNWHPLKYVNTTWVEIEATDDGVRGDVTGDGLVDVADVNAVISIMLGKTEASSYKGVADVTADGIIDVSDVNAVIAITLGNQ